MRVQCIDALPVRHILEFNSFANSLDKKPLLTNRSECTLVAAFRSTIVDRRREG